MVFLCLVKPYKIRESENNLKIITFLFALYIINDIYLFSDNKEVITNFKRGGNSLIRQKIK